MLPGRLADKTYLNAMLFPHPLCCHRPQRLCEVRLLFYDVQASHGEVCSERGTRHLCPHNWDPIKLGSSDKWEEESYQGQCHQRFPAATRYSLRRDPFLLAIQVYISFEIWWIDLVTFPHALCNRREGPFVCFGSRRRLQSLLTNNTHQFSFNCGYCSSVIMPSDLYFSIVITS